MHQQKSYCIWLQLGKQCIQVQRHPEHNQELRMNINQRSQTERCHRSYPWCRHLYKKCKQKYLLKHDCIVIVNTCSLRKYEKRVVISSLDMVPQPGKMKCKNQGTKTTWVKMAIKLSILFCDNFTILCLSSIEPNAPYALQNSALQKPCEGIGIGRKSSSILMKGTEQNK